ncbi:hypothetical protein KFK09_025714 [Dendrobium nobile]|uniref:Uncharacterized protein n=1 Tax=Dendrobium nobile TaxID=94219 RepID=A0A8T3A663_DENNO|nr:hypothetical protein KFK09_025714 [Dendrobium nobile]
MLPSALNTNPHSNSGSAIHHRSAEGRRQEKKGWAALKSAGLTRGKEGRAVEGETVAMLGPAARGGRIMNFGRIEMPILHLVRAFETFGMPHFSLLGKPNPSYSPPFGLFAQTERTRRKGSARVEATGEESGGFGGGFRRPTLGKIVGEIKGRLRCWTIGEKKFVRILGGSRSFEVFLSWNKKVSQTLTALCDGFSTYLRE